MQGLAQSQVRSIVAISCTRTSRPCIWRFRIRLRSRKEPSPQPSLSLSQRSSTQARCSSGIGTRRSIRAGRLAARTASAAVLPRRMPVLILRRKTNQAGAAEPRN
jgi:hypothetical protein